MQRRMLNRGRGATLIELVITIAIVSIALLTLITLTSRSAQQSVDPMIREQSVAIAQAYLEEIVQKGFCDPDVAGDCVAACAGSGACGNAACTASEGASRQLFDDVCDYDGLSDSGARDQNGSLIPGLEQYQVSVSILDSGMLGPAGSELDAANGEMVRADVSVTHPAMPEAVEISSYRANY